jgi:splicing factor 3B subunit 3
MIAAVEKQKLVYILNRDSQAHLTISSPLEAHKSNTICFNLVGIDVGFENPMFACLEVDYEEADQDHTGEAAAQTEQSLTFYELDLGLNHVVRKYSESLTNYANMLIAVPGGTEGPSGVIVCCENYIFYKNFGDQMDIKCPIPRRRSDLDDINRNLIFVCSATHKTKSMFFFLVQTEQGDIFKITLKTDDDFVTEVRIKYFDTVPVASSMCVLKTGFLFVASEFGNHYLYQIAHLADDDDEPEFSSAMSMEEDETFFFEARALKNLVLVDEMDSLSPIISCQISDLANEDTPQLFVACGRSSRSTLRVLRHGLEVSEMAVSELPGNPSAVWTVKKKSDDEFDSYIIVSFLNATLVLSIGETVEEVTDSGFLGTMPTICCSQLGDNALIQIYPEGIRHIRVDKRVNEWKAPSKKLIVQAAVNQRQVVIALTGGEIVYFEMDSSGQLNEYTERKDTGCDVISMALASVPPGELRTRFLAVSLSDDSVKIISLDPKDCLTLLTSQVLPSPAESLCIVEMKGLDYENNSNNQQQSQTNTLFLNVGLQNGALLRTVLDPVTGELLDTRTRYLGSRPVKLFKISIQSAEAVLALSSRSWLSYMYQGRFHLTPLSYETLEHASGFASEQCPEGIVAISVNTLRILALEKLGAVFNQETKTLKYTPRKFAINNDNGLLYSIETDYLTYTEQTKELRKQQMAEQMVADADSDEQRLAIEMANAFIKTNLPEEIFGAPKAAAGSWASAIRIMDPLNKDIKTSFELEQNEAAFSVAFVKFSSRPNNQAFLLVGVAKDLVLNPRSCKGGFIYTYQVHDNGERLEMLHKTPIEDIPGAICPFKGRVLIGVGRFLRIYDLGKKKLLRKCENKQLPNFVNQIQTVGPRIIVCDSHESCFFMRYKTEDNQIIIFADDSMPRFVTALAILDYNTVSIGDKFGNIVVLRLPQGTVDEVNIDPTGDKGLWDRGLLNGSSQKTQLLCSFHLGETITSLQKTTLIPGGNDALVYTTLSGSIGMVVPFSSNEVFIILLIEFKENYNLYFLLFLRIETFFNILRCT